MKSKPPSNFLTFLLASVAVAGALILILYPDLVSGMWSIPAWIVTGAMAVAAGVVWMKRKEINREADKEEKQKRLKRAEELNKRREEQEARVKERREQAAQEEAKKAAKRAEEKAEMVKQAKTVWAERVAKAQGREKLAREIVEKAGKMTIREAAGQAAIEWAAAARLADWTSQQILKAMERPDVKSDAREEVREAMIAAAQIKERGGTWTKAQGDAMAELKEKAREEAKAEEARQDAVRDIIYKAEAEWNIAELRAERAEKELKEMASRGGV